MTEVPPDATAVAGAIRSGAITPAAACEEALDRIDHADVGGPGNEDLVLRLVQQLSERRPDRTAVRHP